MTRYEFGIGDFFGETLEGAWREGMTFEQATQWVEEFYEDTPDKANKRFRVIRRPVGPWEEVH